MSIVGARPSLTGRFSVYALLCAAAFLFLLPILWLLRSSLCDEKAVIEPLTTLQNLLPPQSHPENYPEVFRIVPFMRYLLNTLTITVCVVAGTVLSSSLCAYGFAFCRVPYKKTVFYAVLATMMLPGIVTLIPQFILFRTLGWFDTFKPLIVPAFFGNAFAIFLFRQFFLSLPRELIEAARIDGATSLEIYWMIILPLSRPAIITVALFAFIGAWNDFMGPLIFLNSQENWTLQLGLNSFMGQVANQWNLLMAAAAMTLAPILLLFFLLQRYFIEGIAATGMKN